MAPTEKAVEERILTFRVGSGYYGVPLEWVLAVQGSAEDDGGKETVEKTSYRGDDVSVIDLPFYFEEPNWGYRTREYLIIGHEKALVAVAVEETGRVVAMGKRHEWPALCTELVGKYFTGVVEEERRLVLLIDPGVMAREIGIAGEAAGEAKVDDQNFIG